MSPAVNLLQRLQQATSAGKTALPGDHLSQVVCKENMDCELAGSCQSTNNSLQPHLEHHAGFGRADPLRLSWCPWLHAGDLQVANAVAACGAEA